VIIVATLLAGAAGAVIRFLASRLTTRGVLLVNVLGSFIAGLAMGATSDQSLLLVLVTGFCGGLTTFSAFAVETVQLVMSGKTRVALLSVGLNLVLGVGAAAVGFVLT